MTFGVQAAHSSLRMDRLGRRGPGRTPVRDSGLPPTAAAGQGAARTPVGPPEALEPRHWNLSSRPLLTARSVSLPFGVSLIL